MQQIEHRETHPVPYTLTWEGDVGDRLDAYYGSDGWRRALDPAIRRIPGPSLGVVSHLMAQYTDPYGSTWQADRRPFHLLKPAISAPSLEGYLWPSVDACFEPDWKEQALAAVKELQGHFLVVGFGFGLFERTWALRGFSEALMDAVASPGFYAELLEAVAAHQMAIIERLLELPVDGILFSDDWGYQRGVLLGANRWRQLLKPHLARMYARVHDAGKYVLSHCCGDVAEILPDLIEIGVDVLESVQPEAMDPYELKQRYGEDMTFWGGLGSQSVIPLGRPDEIRREVARLCCEMARGGGYILSPAKPLQPDTPTENAAAVVEAFLDQGGALHGCSPTWQRLQV